jgi:hypothetical protein
MVALVAVAVEIPIKDLVVLPHLAVKEILAVQETQAGLSTSHQGVVEALVQLVEMGLSPMLVVVAQEVHHL